MSIRVEIARTAAREIEERYERIEEQGRNSAEKWRAGLIEAVEALGTNPEMYPEAPEAEWFGKGLREFYYGKRRNTYRILFEVCAGTSSTSSASATAARTCSSRKNFETRLPAAQCLSKNHFISCQPGSKVRPVAAAVASWY